MMGLLRRILRLPEGNPPLPAGDPSSVQVWNPGPAYFRYRLLLFLVAGLPSLLVVLLAVGGGLGGMGLAMLNEGAPAIVAAMPVVLGGGISFHVLLTMAFGVFRIRLEQDMLRYTLTDEAIRLRRGVVAIEEITLSFANIQNVKLHQGVLQRAFGVADLLVETAGGGGGASAEGGGGGHVGLIVGVSEPEALRELIVTRARQHRGDGLHRPAPRAAAMRSVAAVPPEALALLREAVADLQAARKALAGSRPAPP